MAKTRIRWNYLPLLETFEEHAPDRVVIDGTLILLANGNVVIHNRVFYGNYFGLFGGDEIDFAFPGGHAYRKRHSNVLTIKTAGPDGHTLLYRFSAWTGPFHIWPSWYQLLPRIK